MKKNYSFKIISLVSFVAVATYLGVLFSFNLFKYSAAFVQLLVFLASLRIIIVRNRYVNWKIALPILMLITIYPITSILLSSVLSLDFKHFTDGFFIYGGYYQLPVIGLALALVSFNKENELEIALSKYAPIAFAMGVLLMIFSFNLLSENGDVTMGYLAYTVCFIPISLLALYANPNKKYYYLGWISIVIILFFSAQQSSRSYSLIALYLATTSIIALYKYDKQRAVLFTFIGVLFYFSGWISIFYKTTIRQSDTNISDKFQFDALQDSISNFLATGDFWKLFFWEGNSRSDILIDAFGDFSFIDWLFGRGIFATYISFVERSTIELGWAQECFRWGILYVILTIIFFIFGMLFLRLKRISRTNNLYQPLSALVLIKVLDSFVYGSPEYTVYNLLVFCGVMLQSIKKSSFPRLAQ